MMVAHDRLRRDPVQTQSAPSARRREWSYGVRLGAAAGVYGIVAVAPLFVILVGGQPRDRGFWIEFGVALGFIGLVMLCLQSVLTARYPRLSAAVGQDTMLQFHRQAGIVAFGFVLAHPVALLFANGDYWAFLDLRDNFLRAAFLIVVLFALPVLIVTSLWRETFRLPYQWWRLGHGALAGFILLVGIVHITRVRHYLSDPWKQALWTVLASASIASILYVRAIKPLRVGRHPYRVVAVEPVAARTWAITLEPEHDRVLRFGAGQFAFLTLADRAFSLEQHPFSLASSAHDPDRVQFTVKELGDFTRQIGTTAVGRRAFVDGPYGSMHLPADRSAPLLFVAGGVGIAPVMSMLRTLRDEDHQAPVLLVYAADAEDDLAFGCELDAISSAIDLTVVRVLATPPAGWSGSVGFIDPDLLRRHLRGWPTDRLCAVVCGPPRMMEVVEDALFGLGVPLGHIQSERFDIGAADAVGRRSTQVRRLVLALGALLVAVAAVFAW